MHQADKIFRIVRNMQGRGRDCAELGECDPVGGNDDDQIRGSAGCGFSPQIDRASGLFEPITMINVRFSSRLLISCAVYSVLNRIVWSEPWGSTAFQFTWAPVSWRVGDNPMNRIVQSAEPGNRRDLLRGNIF